MIQKVTMIWWNRICSTRSYFPLSKRRNLKGNNDVWTYIHVTLTNEPNCTMSPPKWRLPFYFEMVHLKWIRLSLHGWFVSSTLRAKDHHIPGWQCSTSEFKISLKVHPNQYNIRIPAIYRCQRFPDRTNDKQWIHLSLQERYLKLHKMHFRGNSTIDSSQIGQ